MDENEKEKAFSQFTAMGGSLMKCLVNTVKKFRSPEVVKDTLVLLKPLSLQIGNQTQSLNQVKLSTDKLIATRIGEDYQNSFVILHRINRLIRMFIVVEILAVDDQHIGGIRLYFKNNRNEKVDLHSYSKCEPNDFIVMWIDNPNTDKYYLHCKRAIRDDEIHKTFPVDGLFELFCDMYGAVKKIRAYHGVEDDAESTSSECEEALEAKPNDSREDVNIVAGPTILHDNQRCDPNQSVAEPHSSSSSVIKSSVTVTTTSETNETISVSNPHLIFDTSNKSISRIVVHIPSLNEGTISCSAGQSNNAESDHTIEDSSQNNQAAAEECKICMDAEARVILIPCGHMCFCYNCSARIATRCERICPLCRTAFEHWQTVYTMENSCRSCPTVGANVVSIPCGDACFCLNCWKSGECCPVCLSNMNISQTVFNS